MSVPTEDDRQPDSNAVDLVRWLRSEFLAFFLPLSPIDPYDRDEAAFRRFLQQMANRSWVSPIVEIGLDLPNELVYEADDDILIWCEIVAAALVASSRDDDVLFHEAITRLSRSGHGFVVAITAMGSRCDPQSESALRLLCSNSALTAIHYFALIGALETHADRQSLSAIEHLIECLPDSMPGVSEEAYKIREWMKQFVD